jgi:hypothetical protein
MSLTVLMISPMAWACFGQSEDVFRGGFYLLADTVLGGDGFLDSLAAGLTDLQVALDRLADAACPLGRLIRRLRHLVDGGHGLRDGGRLLLRAGRLLLRAGQKLRAHRGQPHYRLANVGEETGPLFLHAFAACDVAVDLQVGNALADLVALQGPAAGDGDLAAVGAGVHQLPFPAAVAQVFTPDLVKRLGKNGLQEAVDQLSQHFLLFPAIKALGALVPVGDEVIRIAGNDGIPRQVEQFQVPQRVVVRRLTSTPVYLLRRWGLSHELSPIDPPGRCRSAGTATSEDRREE